MVVADPTPEPEMIEEPDSEVIEKTEVGATEGTDAGVFAETASEEILVSYELEVMEEPHQEEEIVEEKESMFSYLLQEVFREHKTTDVEEPTTEPVEASQPVVVKKAPLEVSVVEEETRPVSLYLANIFGKGVPAVAARPQAANAEEEENPAEARKASELEVVEESHQEKEIVEERKSVFSYLQKILKELKR